MLARSARKKSSNSQTSSNYQTESGEGSLFDRNEMAEEPREKRERKERTGRAPLVSTTTRSREREHGLRVTSVEIVDVVLDEDNDTRVED